MSASQCILHGYQCYYVKSHSVTSTSIFKTHFSEGNPFCVSYITHVLTKFILL